MRAEDFDIQKVIEYLQGTINTVDSAVNELYHGMQDEDLTSDEDTKLDMELFECEVCGWWYERVEESDTINVCQDCGDTFGE